MLSVELTCQTPHLASFSEPLKDVPLTVGTTLNIYLQRIDWRKLV
ncbi:MAG: hypothetical protein QXW32_03010 [Nitrososphaerales archaeon]